MKQLVALVEENIIELEDILDLPDDRGINPRLENVLISMFFDVARETIKAITPEESDDTNSKKDTLTIEWDSGWNDCRSEIKKKVRKWLAKKRLNQNLKYER